MEQGRYFLEIALEEAKFTFDEDAIPIGAGLILLKNNGIIATIMIKEVPCNAIG
ncbi:hypothetical protein HPT25_27435 [Bacillus sp. BRMEA1]|uniref:hypothetical protein n=1 Tax=Neobacillus endophyticus TaxID=2738405 RepID=UPI00156331CC|nr:hypothetical protein [Neobacillus endophyticus]NRD81055.1 hypothetical protein [Neobacillus endophyticus]